MPKPKAKQLAIILLIATFILLPLAPQVNANATPNCVLFGYWQNGAWHSVSKVASEMNSSESTGYNQQRNCFIDQQGYYWVFAYEWTLKFVGITNPNSYEGFSSPDGITWSTAQRLLSALDGTNYFDHHFQLHQGLDIAFQSVNETGSYNKGMALICLNDMNYWYRLSFNAGTMTKEDWNLWNSIVNYNSVSHKYANQSAYWAAVENMYHPELSLNRAFGISENAKTFNGYTYAGTAQGSFSLTGGETVTLSWNATHSYYVTVLGNNSVCYGYCSAPSTVQNPSTSMGFSTRAGIDALVGCSDPEVLGFEQGKLHILYVDAASLDLCHRSFDGTSWSSPETVDAGSNVTSPVISTDGTGLLACYVKDSQIKYKYYNGSSWGNEQTLQASISWTNPRYLSASQMTYDGKILMSWTADVITYSITIAASQAELIIYVNGTAYTSPTTITVDSGTLLVIEAPNQSKGFLKVNYYFSKWEDDSTNSTREITLAGDTVITAYFTYTDPRSGYYTILPIIGAGLAIGMIFLMFAIVKSRGEGSIQMIILPLIFMFALILIYIYITVMAGL